MHIVSLSLFMFIANLLFAQDPNTSTQSTTQQTRNTPVVSFGIKGGINLANVESELYKSSKNVTGFHVGAFSQINLSSHFAIQPEVVYSMQGFESKLPSDYEVKARYGYINIPVMIQYKIRAVRIETGPQLGFLTNAEFEYNDGREDEIKDYLKSTDFSWGFGASYIFPIRVGLHAKYNLGITDINEKITTPGITDDEIKNRVWQFGLFYQFR